MSEEGICNYWRSCKHGISKHECVLSICACRNDLINEYEPKEIEQ